MCDYQVLSHNCYSARAKKLLINRLGLSTKKVEKWTRDQWLSVHCTKNKDSTLKHDVSLWRRQRGAPPCRRRRVPPQRPRRRRRRHRPLCEQLVPAAAADPEGRDLELGPGVLLRRQQQEAEQRLERQQAVAQLQFVQPHPGQQHQREEHNRRVVLQPDCHRQGGRQGKAGHDFNFHSHKLFIMCQPLPDVIFDHL